MSVVFNTGVECVGALLFSIVKLLEHKVEPSELASFGVMQADHCSSDLVSSWEIILYLGDVLL